MVGHGMIDGADFDLDFHAIQHWGQEPALERHYVPKRSQRTRSVLTMFAQDHGTHNLIYANADASKAAQNREVIAFADYWRELTGEWPAQLVFDQRLTTQTELAELDARGITFIALRMRSKSLMNQIAALEADPKPGRPSGSIGPAATSPPRSSTSPPSPSRRIRAPSASSSSKASAATPPP